MIWTSNSRNVTISDVAERAGVSRMTVSKVLRDTGSISLPTRERVMAAVKELGYVKNSLAGHLSTRTTSIIAVLIPSVSDIIFAEMLSGINSVIRPKGFSTLIAENLFDPVLEHETLSDLLSMQPAGLIISGGLNPSEEKPLLLERRRCPLVSIWDGDARMGDDTIGLSHYAAGEMMAEHFVERGYRRFGYIGSELHLDVCARHRRDGFIRGLSSHGYTIESLVSDKLPRQSASGRELTAQFMETRNNENTPAIFYLNDAMALGGLQWLADNGHEAPTRVAVAGFNGTSINQTIHTQLTTLDVPRREIGCRAAQSILDLLDGREPPPSPLVELQLVQGSTT